MFTVKAFLNPQSSKLQPNPSLPGTFESLWAIFFRDLISSLLSKGEKARAWLQETERRGGALSFDHSLLCVQIFLPPLVSFHFLVPGVSTSEPFCNTVGDLAVF